jgi:hypothetical protein
MSGRRAARRTALFLLYQWDLTQQPLASLYEGEVDPFARELAEAVIERAEELDREITESADDWSADRLGTLERNILRIGSFELRRAGEALHVRRCLASRERDPGKDRAGESGLSTPAEDALRRAEELLDRLEQTRARLEATSDPDQAIDVLTELAEIAKQVEAEIEQARREADA